MSALRSAAVGSVLKIVWMTRRAVGKQDALESTVPILAIGDGFKVVGVTTPSVATEVVEVEAIANRGDEVLVRPTVGADASPVSAMLPRYLEPPVPFPPNPPEPAPAFALLRVERDHLL